jgi:hypothetical protein
MTLRHVDPADGAGNAFARSDFAQMMASGPGRLVRIVAGIAILLWGANLLPTAIGFVLLAAAILPTSAGLFDFSLLSPLFGGPFWGSDIRAAEP